MNKEIITFGETEIEKHIFHQHKRPISIHDRDINKILVSNKVSLVEKSFNILLATKLLKKFLIKLNR